MSMHCNRDMDEQWNLVMLKVDGMTEAMQRVENISTTVKTALNSGLWIRADTVVINPLYLESSRRRSHH
jgi:hypothetical protein